MRRALILFLTVEIFVVGLYAWRAYVWYGWRQVGPDAFPGSPDAVYLYQSAERSSTWIEGLVVGILIGAVGISLSYRASSYQPGSKAEAALRAAICVVPLVALALVNLSFMYRSNT